ncbi:hypothetical protein DAD186_15750 [Dermabacter vaginalis]|uniref:Uncharacterized protein n=1 Tax=Dermabacter vaginalis TaxID=1630135 RepID=A0A1B0ZJC1_9MICO|nr:hypothetical protein DAD186_15750 [Dermabacter vaginalis]
MRSLSFRTLDLCGCSGAEAIRPAGTCAAHRARTTPTVSCTYHCKCKKHAPTRGPSRTDVIVRSSAGVRVPCQREDVVNSCQM